MKFCSIILLSFLSQATTQLPYQDSTHIRFKNKADSMRIDRAIKATIKKLRQLKLLVP